MTNPQITIKGFQFAGVAAKIKASSKKDVALIYSEVPAVVVGSFTTGKVQAAPVAISKKNIRSGVCQAVITNSGNANACTGKVGLRDAEAMVKETAQQLHLSPKNVLVCSTGKIGVTLPMDKVIHGIRKSVESLSYDNFHAAAEAILTTDQGVKCASIKSKFGKVPYTIAGFSKGAGMIEPHMKVEKSGGAKHATMLAYVMTDVSIGRKLLEKIFERCVEATFNCITVDGDMSTNDTALLLANGLAGNKPLKENSREAKQFESQLKSILDDLAKLMVIDGEGATKCVRIEVKGAKNDAEARKMAYVIANSPLVKTSFFGQDPNWGRIMGALGRSGTSLNADKVSISYNDVCVVKKGMGTGSRTDAAAKTVMKNPFFTVTIDCHLGKGQHGVYASDLTLEYVKINSCYRT